MAFQNPDHTATFGRVHRALVGDNRGVVERMRGKTSEHLLHHGAIDNPDGFRRERRRHVSRMDPAVSPMQAKRPGD